MAISRRRLLQGAGVLGVAGTRPALLAEVLTQAASPAATPIQTVLLVAKCHLDVGFSMTQRKVMQRYFEVYFPQAIAVAARQRAEGDEPYTWTTGSWLLYEYLEQAAPAERRAAEQAIATRGLAWHALPFSWQTEMIDRSMIDGAMSFSKTLDQRFGTVTTGAKMTDVPGHSRGLIAPLAAAGVRLLDVGVNAASTPPDVPDVFLWRDADGRSVAVLYHRHDYGSLVEIPGTGVAVDVEVRTDNSGPHTPEEIAAIYARLRKLYPGATVRAATMSDVAGVVDTVRKSLPVVMQEIGDTWIYGCASDPDKVAGYRSTARLRQDWIVAGRFATGDATDRALLRRLLLAAEHTWGTDTKSYLDYEHYRPADLAMVIDQPSYVVMETSWKEKREDILDGIASLPTDLKAQAMNGLNACRPTVPEVSGMEDHDLAKPIELAGFTLRFDMATGAITSLRNRKTGVEWASAECPLALFTYQTLSAEEYTAYIKRYLVVETWWGPRDFGKPNIGAFGAAAREWHPRPVRCHVDSRRRPTRVVLELAMRDSAAEATGNVAWPKQMFLEIVAAAGRPSLALRFSTFGKQANRLPEAMWMTFAPRAVKPESWAMEKVNQWVRADDVVRGGGRTMHAVTGRVRGAQAAGQQFMVETVDAPVVALGQRSPLNYSLELPDLSKGIHVSLFNNGWGTNYPQWSGGDWLYRMELSA